MHSVRGGCFSRGKSRCILVSKKKFTKKLKARWQYDPSCKSRAPLGWIISWIRTLASRNEISKVNFYQLSKMQYFPIKKGKSVWSSEEKNGVKHIKRGFRRESCIIGLLIRLVLIRAARQQAVFSHRFQLKIRLFFKSCFFVNLLWATGSGDLGFILDSRR